MQKNYRLIAKLSSERLGAHSILELLAADGREITIRKNLAYVTNATIGRKNTEVFISFPFEGNENVHGVSYVFRIGDNGSLMTNPKTGKVIPNFYTHYRVIERK
jgi:hypothetical protein